jgi:L-aspartate oxidase
MHGSFDERRYLIPFRSALLPQIFTDVLVIGTGVAGLSAALSAATDADVIVLAKTEPSESNTSQAQGGIAAAMSPEDSAANHAANTLEAGAGLCDEPVVQRILADAPRQMQQLIDLGMPFDQDANGQPALGREGGHDHHRILHADGDATGRALSSTLLNAVRSNDQIRLFDQCFALDFLGDDGRCLGAITHHARYGLQVIWARATILASGGSGRVYRESTNPHVATGDGLAMAYRAGAEVADLEFMQFHPTTLYVAGASRSLITEAVRGEGATLVNNQGERFMVPIHERAELAPRDIVARAILDQVHRHQQHVYLDPTPIGAERFVQRFPGISRVLRQFDIDPGKDLIPIRPAAHYHIGGVWADEAGRTNLSGLYACGEAACTGLHGANRLASNSLLEGLICGEQTGLAALADTANRPILPIKIISDIPPSSRGDLDLHDVRSTLRAAMWRHVGIERDGSHLEAVSERFDYWARYTLDKIFDDRTGWEVQNLLWVGAMMIRAAAWRTESRGTHFRTDYPESDPSFAHHVLWQRNREAVRQIDVVPGPTPSRRTG